MAPPLLRFCAAAAAAGLRGAAAHTANTCTTLPQPTCYENKKGKVASVGVSADPGACCDACWANAGCVSWCHYPHDGKWKCNLYKDIGPTKQGTDGCSAGIRSQSPAGPTPAPAPVPPAPAPPPPVPTPPAPAPSGGRPNILFILGETCNKYHLGDEAARPVALPNVDRLRNRGLSFLQTYVAHPVCCPSRSTIWSGRHAHHLAHQQSNPTTGLYVSGAWNNHEGLASDWSQKDPYINSSPRILNDTFASLLGEAGYEVDIQGKTDVGSGSHSVHARVTSWTEEVRFPCLAGGLAAEGCNGSAGWTSESFPEVKVNDDDSKKCHSGDWGTTDKTIDFIKKMAGRKAPPAGGGELAPWFAYIGHHICHPSYVTNTRWYKLVNGSAIRIPPWQPLERMHPEDAEVAMKKHLAAPDCCSDDTKLQLRQVFYSMVAEYDAMIGALLDAVEGHGFENATWVVHTTDHGDMALEHRSWYKMQHYDASTRVPMIITPPPGFKADAFAPGRLVATPVSTLDILPTMLGLASVAPPSVLDGHSLLPYFNTSGFTRPGIVASQEHGEDIHLSWYLVRHAEWKYVVYGDNTEVPPRLYNMTADPYEEDDLYGPQYAGVAAQLDTMLRGEINYTQVTPEVRGYNKQSFKLWRASMSSDDYKSQLGQIWESNLKMKGVDSSAVEQAIDDWLGA